MNAFKRLCLFFFGLAGLAALTALMLPWFGPWTEQAVRMLRVPWYYITLEVCVGIAALGLLISLLRALFAPRRTKTVIVSMADSDKITVTTSAISSQAAHIVESRGDFTAEKVWVNATKRAVDVSLRVRPLYAMNIAEVGTALHAELVGGLSEIAGDAIRSIDIEFVEADSLDAAPEAAYGQGGGTAGPAAAALPEQGMAAANEPHYEITVPMGHAAAESAPIADAVPAVADEAVDAGFDPRPYEVAAAEEPYELPGESPAAALEAYREADPALDAAPAATEED